MYLIHNITLQKAAYQSKAFSITTLKQGENYQVQNNSQCIWRSERWLKYIQYNLECSSVTVTTWLRFYERWAVIEPVKLVVVCFTHLDKQIYWNATTSFVFVFIFSRAICKSSRIFTQGLSSFKVVHKNKHKQKHCQT